MAMTELGWQYQDMAPRIPIRPKAHGNPRERSSEELLEMTVTVANHLKQDVTRLCEFTTRTPSTPNQNGTKRGVGKAKKRAIGGHTARLPALHRRTGTETGTETGTGA